MKTEEVDRILDHFRGEDGELDFQLLEYGLGKTLMQVWRETGNNETKLLIFYTLVRTLKTETRFKQVLELIFKLL
jgi:hypothetical protein